MMLNGWEQDIDDELNAGEYHLFDGKWPIEKEDDLPMKKSDVREQTLEFPYLLDPILHIASCLPMTNPNWKWTYVHPSNFVDI